MEKIIFAMGGKGDRDGQLVSIETCAHMCGERERERERMQSCNPFMNTYQGSVPSLLYYCF
jgi:hypothetical protein